MHPCSLQKPQFCGERTKERAAADKHLCRPRTCDEPGLQSGSEKERINGQNSLVLDTALSLLLLLSCICAGPCVSFHVRNIDDTLYEVTGQIWLLGLLADILSVCPVIRKSIEQTVLRHNIYLFNTKTKNSGPSFFFFSPFLFFSGGYTYALVTYMPTHHRDADKAGRADVAQQQNVERGEKHMIMHGQRKSNASINCNYLKMTNFWRRLGR
jgi:hypothetical protein